jgi:hypothetical protein
MKANSAELRFNVAGFGWKSYSEEANQPVTFSGSDVRGAQWIRSVLPRRRRGAKLMSTG